ncbi:unnamed protein product, partial [Mesorhabditis spiculigera]
MEKWIVQMTEAVFPMQAALGIVGNFINLLVLFSRHMRSRANTLLAFAAISDILFLMSMIPHNMARRAVYMFRECDPDMNVTTTKCYTEFAHFYFANKSLFTFFLNCFSSFSTWLIVVVTFDRLWAIKSPFSARKNSFRCSFREILIVPLLFFVSVITTIHYCFNMQTKQENGKYSQRLILPEKMINILITIQLFHATCIPVFLLLVLNMLLLYYLRNRRQYFESVSINRESSRRTTRSDSDFQDGSPPLIEVEPPNVHSLVIPSGSQGQAYAGPTGQSRNAFQSAVAQLRVNSTSLWNRQLSKAERHVTITVIAIVSCYIITHLPSAVIVARMYINSIAGSMYSQKSSYTWVAISNFFVISGKVTNFFLFCLSSKHFRHHLKNKLLMWRRASWSSKKTSRPRIELHSAMSNTDNGGCSSVGLRLVVPAPSPVPSAVELQDNSNGLPRTRSLPLERQESYVESAIAPV